MAWPPSSPLCTRNTWRVPWASCRSRKAQPGTRPHVFLMRWLRPDCLFTPVTCSPGGDTKRLGSSIQRGRLSECLAGGFGSSVLPCLMSHLGVGRARTKLACWLATSHFGLWCGERERELLATFHAACAFLQRGGRQRRRLRVPVIRELRVAASLIFLAHRDLSTPWCPEVSVFRCFSKRWCCGSRFGTSYGGERNGPLSRSLAAFPLTGV